MYTKILTWLLQKAFDGKRRKLIEPKIKDLYLKMSIDNLHIRSEILKVKKGKEKYKLLFFETPQGNLKFNLNRHTEFHMKSLN